ncbi:Chromosome-associated kinesin kif4a [Rhizophlyctis rosea]|nr:Chromosome-associated kinesin kif4a [Rhizophlyctis rosea]
MSSPTPQRVLVAVRVRPPIIERKTPQKFSTNLEYDPTATCITYNPSTVTIQWPSETPTAGRVTTPAQGAAKSEPRKFNYDAVLGYEDGQAAVYEKVVETMEGPKRGADLEPPTDPKDPDTGIILRVASQITTHIRKAAKTNPELEYFVKASYLEIYQEGLTDLLVERSEQSDLRIRQDPDSVTGRDLYISGITERSLSSIQDYVKLLLIGGRHRTVGETNMNEVSSRSHAVLTLTIEERRKPESGMSTEEAEMLAKHGKKRSKIHLIDLAGSERANATGATGDRLKEGSAINQSLSCLGNVINALTTSQKHVPYRDSKLTYLLSDSIGGNSLTLMITCVTPTLSNHDESLSTLRFAERVKKVKNAAKVNVDATMMRIMQLEAEIKALRDMLAKCTCGAARGLEKVGKDVGVGGEGGGRDVWGPSSGSESREMPWYKRIFKQCAGGAGRAKSTTSRVTPVVSGSADGDEEEEETVLKSSAGKLQFA